MDADERRQHAAHNLEVFKRVLSPYVALKISNVARSLERGSHNAWLDASGCVWCLFDDPAFIRSENEAANQSVLPEDGSGFNVFWSMGDIVMPHECDAEWVAKRIVEEAMLQLPKLGLHRRAQSRVIDGERHKGVLFAKTIFNLR